MEWRRPTNQTTNSIAPLCEEGPFGKYKWVDQQGRRGDPQKIPKDAAAAAAAAATAATAAAEQTEKFLFWANSELANFC